LTLPPTTCAVGGWRVISASLSCRVRLTGRLIATATAATALLLITAIVLRAASAFAGALLRLRGVCRRRDGRRAAG